VPGAHEVGAGLLDRAEGDRERAVPVLVLHLDGAPADALLPLVQLDGHLLARDEGVEPPGGDEPLAGEHPALAAVGDRLDADGDRGLGGRRGRGRRGGRGVDGRDAGLGLRRGRDREHDEEREEEGARSHGGHILSDPPGSYPGLAPLHSRGAHAISRRRM
jgi:hypothetical protein